MKKEIAGERLPVVHGLFADRQELFELAHFDAPLFARPKLRAEDDAGDVHVRRAIDSALLQFVEEIVEHVHVFRMEMDGAILFTQDDAVFMMVKTDGVVADAKQPFGQFFALRLWIDLSSRDEIDAVEPLVDTRKSFEFKMFSNGFHPSVFAGGGVCEMHFGEIENGIFLDAEDGVQRNPFVSGNQFYELRFVERKRGGHGEIDTE